MGYFFKIQGYLQKMRLKRRPETLFIDLAKNETSLEWQGTIDKKDNKQFKFIKVVTEVSSFVGNHVTVE